MSNQELITKIEQAQKALHELLSFRKIHDDISHNHLITQEINELEFMKKWVEGAR